MVVPTTTTREVHYHGTLRPTLCGLNMSCRALVRTVSSSRPSEAISMDQPGEGKQLLNVCERSRESPNFRFFHATPPSPSSWVPTCQFSSYFIILLLVTLPCYCLLFITATPLRRLRYAVTRAPLSCCLRGGSGRLGNGPGRMRQSKLTPVHPCAHQLASAPMGPAPRPANGPRAGPHWVPGGQELDRGRAIAHGSALNDA